MRSSEYLALFIAILAAAIAVGLGVDAYGYHHYAHAGLFVGIAFLWSLIIVAVLLVKIANRVGKQASKS